VSSNKCPVIMLAMDDKGIPKTSEERMVIISQLIEETRRLGMADELIYIDPLVMALAVNTESAKIVLKTMQAIRTQFPKAHIVSGLSNVSFGLPARSLINRVFLTLAIEAGMDSAILDPLDKGLNSTILASELALGKDRFCLSYTRAFRAGKL
jgi:5-methyltetrahydrofolate corrinoid/iron sulfur protein methyltransferase